MQEWLIDEVNPYGPREIEESQKSSSLNLAIVRGMREIPNIAVRIHDLVIYDNKKWFSGEADIRLDAFVVHGHGVKGRPDRSYEPHTFRFPRVADGDMLPLGEEGLLLFYGFPLYFLDFFLLVSRDRKNSEDLSDLLSKQLQTPETKQAVDTLLGLAIAAPQAAAIAAAVGAAARIGEFVYEIVSKVTGNTIGLYRNSFLEHRDRFGIGRHPTEATYREKDLSFWYEIVAEKAE